VHTEKNIVHRDIKPQNILITHDNMAKLSDFGVSQIIDPKEGDILRKTEGTY
jgi:serine/threonine protein kinase